MSDLKKAQLAEAKLDAQVAEAGLHITDYQPPTVPFFSFIPGNEISGVLDGTHSLTLVHNMLDRQHDLNFTIEGGHNFNLTLAGFEPLMHGSATPPEWQLGFSNGVPHDLLQLTFDTSTGVTNLAQAAADQHVEQHGNDIVLHIDTPSAHGTITFQNIADLVPAGQTEFFSWIDHVGNATQVV